MTTENSQMLTIQQEVRELVEQNILKYWMEKMVDNENGAFYGRRDGNDNLDSTAPKSVVLNARILWAFSAAYRVLGKPEYREMAVRAKDYILEHFIDTEFGGAYWTIDYQGKPLDTKKHVYAMAVTLFALSEYLHATDDESVLEPAKGLFYNIEGRMADGINAGYNEAMSRTWLPVIDVRLSEQDESTDRSLNTHLHLLEAYTNFYRVWPREVLNKRIRKLMGLMLEKMVNPTTSHLGMFFSEAWQGGKEIRSYGHSIEAAWLLLDAANALGDGPLLRHVSAKVPKMIAAASEGLRPNGGMIYMSTRENEQSAWRHIEDYHWWVQAESILGHWYLYRQLGDEAALSAVIEGIAFVKEHLVDWKDGEWFWSCDASLNPNRTEDKAGMWKDPCHNTRMCLSILEN